MKSNPSVGGSASAQPAGKAIQLSLAQCPHRNQQLFSDHYLNVILPGREDWQRLAVEAKTVMRGLRGIERGKP